MTSDRRVATVVTVSDRSAVGERPDRSGPLAASLLHEAGWAADVVVVPDERESIAEAIRTAAQRGDGLVVTTGGTGLSPRDVTPEATAPLLTRELPGVAERIRAVGVEQLPQAMLSRGLAGVVGRTLVVNLAGSPGAVSDGVPVLLAVASHVIDQLDGGDHS
ncbi:MogA/MoaB family molybdenum cofactor biosynthesis protein [Rothia sp. AR01]|uniref:MogA/MoaB family molybdenum cofactor biosynthesis protein n=1 Tax=Rothia santali TaxID=2949643 RepID=A0A9X2HF60_9MICC|nr:MogA/MoaB family molybdenum cofactor biosynthesis protein [Rothia santali]MCP3424576.1 MogA/MoaB family molybdenum cofactor biosynthesis protein [Rothia santali]